MEPVDSGQFKYHNCQKEREVEGRLRMPDMHFSMNNFSSVQMIIRKRRRDEAKEDKEQQHCHQHHRHNNQSTTKQTSQFSSSPLVLLATFLLCFLCLAPLGKVQSLPYNSRDSLLTSARDGRSQMDLLLDPIHQAEFGEDEPLEVKRVVAKSVFDMVLRTTPSSASNKCPPGTQSPFEGGPCIKKSTDAGPIIDQSFLLNHLIGLANNGVILPTTSTKTRKRKPGRPGGGSGSRTTTTPSPTTTSTQPPTTTPTVITTLPTEASTPPPPTTTILSINNEGDNAEFMTDSSSPTDDNQPVVFVEESTIETNLPSTIPTSTTTTVPSESGGDAGSVESFDETRDVNRRITSPSENDEQIEVTNEPALTTLDEKVSKVPANVSENASSFLFPPEQKKSDQDNQKSEDLFNSASTTVQSPELVDSISEVNSQPKIIGVTEDSFSLLDISPTASLIKNADKNIELSNKASIAPLSIVESATEKQEDLEISTNKMNEQLMTDEEAIQSSSPSFMTNFGQVVDNVDHDDDITSASADHEKMTDVITPSNKEEVKQGDILPFLSPSSSGEEKDNVFNEDKQADDEAMTIATRMMKDYDSDNNKDSVKIDFDKGTPVPEVTSTSLTLAEEAEGTPLVSATSASFADDGDASGLDELLFLDSKGDGEQSTPQVPIKDSTTVVTLMESKRTKGEEKGAIAEEAISPTKIEPSRQEPDAIKVKQVLEMAITGNDEEAMRGKAGEEQVGAKKKGVIEEEQKGDGQPSSFDSPAVNQSMTIEADPTTDSVVTFGDAENMEDNIDEKGAAADMIPEEEENQNGDDLQTINNPPYHNFNYQKGGDADNKDDEEIKTTVLLESARLTENDKKDEDHYNDAGSSSREHNNDGKLNEETLNQSTEQEKIEPVLDPVVATLIPPPLPSSTPFHQTFHPTKDGNQFHFPIVSRFPFTNKDKSEEGTTGFQKLAEFPVPSPRVRFPSSEETIDVPVEGGSAVRGTTRPIFVQDFPLNYPAATHKEWPQQQPYQKEQQWKTPEPFMSPPPVQFEASGRIPTTEPAQYDSGSTEYLESELDRMHQKTRSRNRMRHEQTQPFLPSSTSSPIPFNLSFYSPATGSNHHNSRNDVNFPSEIQQPSPSTSPSIFFARRNNPEFVPFGYLNNYRTAQDRFHNNNRRLIW